MLFLLKEFHFVIRDSVILFHYSEILMNNVIGFYESYLNKK